MEEQGVDKLAWIAAGGAAGSVLRYLVAGWVQRGTDGTFPWGTLAVNVSGCFLIGLLAHLFIEHSLIRTEYRMAVRVGVLGGYTTFSTYALECLALGGDGQYARLLGNVLLSNALGLGAAWVGQRTSLLLSGG
jgi:CrcB protein